MYEYVLDIVRQLKSILMVTEINVKHFDQYWESAI